MPRRILRLDAGVVSVAREARFDFEAQLHRAIAAHPEVLPSEDIGLGPLVALANELDLGAGPMDLLAVDARCRRCAPGFRDSLVEHVEEELHRLGESYDEEAFRAGISRSLETGSFVFLYVGRDLDERTRRIMTFLAEGARMTFFAVEVDHFHAGDAHTSVLVPRTTFVPSWVTAPVVRQVTPPPPTPSAETRELTRRMDNLAKEWSLTVVQRRTGRVYLPRTLEPVQYAQSGVGVYASDRGMEVNLNVFRLYGEDAIVEEFLAALGEVTGTSFPQARDWPAVPAPPSSTTGMPLAQRFWIPTSRRGLPMRPRRRSGRDRSYQHYWYKCDESRSRIGRVARDSDDHDPSGRRLRSNRGLSVAPRRLTVTVGENDRHRLPRLLQLGAPSS